MAYIQTTFFSKSLSRPTTFHVLLPNDARSYVTDNNPHYSRPIKSLYLLHGYTGSPTDWLLESNVQALSLKYNLMIVLPNGENSFYLDQKGTGNQFAELIGNEIMNYMNQTFKVSTSRDDTFIGGFSMGGFGALHLGIKYAKNFGKIIGLSSAFIIDHIKSMETDFINELANYDYYYRVFGDLDQAADSENNPEVLIKNQLDKGEEIPPIYLACGTEDFLINENRKFHEFLNAQKIESVYEEGPGIHDWLFWNAYLQKGVKWLLEEQ